MKKRKMKRERKIMKKMKRKVKMMKNRKMMIMDGH